LTSATSGITITGSPVTASGNLNFEIATASGSQNGLLSSTDWNTFNNKQNALTNPITGTGTTNYLPKFTGPSALGNSLIFDNGTTVGVNTATPSSSYKFDVNGLVRVGNISIDGSYTNNTLIGRGSWSSITSDFNTYIGSLSGQSTTTGYANTYLGSFTGGLTTTGIANTFLGYQAGFYHTTGTGNTLIGVDAGYRVIDTNYTTIIGYHTGQYVNKEKTLIIGADAASDTLYNGDMNTIVGYAAGYQNRNGSYNTFLGNKGGYGVRNGSNNVMIGFEAANAISDASNNTIIGYRSGYSITSGSELTFIGALAGFSNTTGLYNTFIGYDSGRFTSSGSTNTSIGYRALYSSTTGYNITSIGAFSSFSLTTGSQSVHIGTNGGRTITTGTFNVFIGENAGFNASQKVDASNSIAIGYATFTTKNNQVVLGNTSISETILNGSVLIGSQSNSGQALQVTGTGYFSNNVSIGATSASYRLDVVGTGIRTAPTTGSTGQWGAFVIGSTLDATAQYFDAFRISGTGAGGYASNNTSIVFQVWNGSSWNTQMAINQGSGGVGIGATSLLNYGLRISKNIQGAATSYAAAVDGLIQSGVTTSASSYYSGTGTQAASFSLTEINHFYAVQGTFGAGSTVTNQYGFRVHASLVGATNDYGFFGDIASGTGRWNFYAQGTALNYMAGALLLGNNVSTGEQLQVTGDTKMTGEILLSDSKTSIVNGDYSANFSKVYTPTSTQTNVNSYGFVSNVTYNLASGTYIGSETYNAAASFAQAVITGNATTKATQPIRAYMAGLVGRTTSPAMNIADFRFFDIKSPDADGVAGHVVDNIYGLKIGTMKGASSFTVTNGWGIYQEGANDNNYFNGSVGVGTASPTAFLDVKAATTSAASLRLRSGTAPTTPNDGDIWFDGTNLKMRIGGVTKTFTIT
jgi:hypothetical protein